MTSVLSSSPFKTVPYASKSQDKYLASDPPENAPFPYGKFIHQMGTLHFDILPPKHASKWANLVISDSK